MARLGIGLTFPGTCEKAFEFYRSVFGGELEELIRFNDDSLKDMDIPESDRDKLAYVLLKVGNTIMDGDDTLEMNGPAPQPGTMMSIMVRADERTEADRIFNALAEGGTVLTPLVDQFWGAYYGGVRDKYGVQWAVRYDEPEHRQ